MVKRHFSTSTADVNAIIMYCIACQTGSLCGGSLLQPRLSLYGCSAGGDCSVVIYIPDRRKENKIYTVETCGRFQVRCRRFFCMNKTDVNAIKAWYVFFFALSGGKIRTVCCNL